MWGVPRSGIEPVSPASAGGVSTTEPPGKPLTFKLLDTFQYFKETNFLENKKLVHFQHKFAFLMKIYLKLCTLNIIMFLILKYI